MFDLSKILWPDGSFTHVSRDALRDAFLDSDKDNDKRYSFDEIWETSRKIAQKNGLIAEPLAAKMMRKSQPDAVTKAKLAGYGKQAGQKPEKVWG